MLPIRSGAGDPLRHRRHHVRRSAQRSDAAIRRGQPDRGSTSELKTVGERSTGFRSRRGMLHACHRRVAGTTKERISTQSSCVRRLILNGFVTTFDSRACPCLPPVALANDPGRVRVSATSGSPGSFHASWRSLYAGARPADRKGAESCELNGGGSAHGRRWKPNSYTFARACALGRNS